MSVPARIKQWWPILEFWSGHFGLDPYVLAAVMDRESGGGEWLRPKGPGGTGDGGHGHGLMQIDDRTWKAWIDADDWRDPAFNIGKGAKILAGGLRTFCQIGGEAGLRAGIAAYNCGPGRVRQALKEGRDPDAYTTKGDYSSDVIKRAGLFRLAF